MNRAELYQQILKKESYLCVGLDTDPDKIPAFLNDFEDPVFEFNKRIIDATKDLCVAYKPNLAFYEALGASGWRSFEKTIEYIPKDQLIIADAKRGDIGNTSKRYAKAFFETMGVDALTIAPYMGEDSVTPFLGFKDKWVVLLGLTSNKGSQDFQMLTDKDGQPFYHSIFKKAQEWANPEELMFVVGATHPEKIAEVRSLAPDNFFLVPGVGAQGGDLNAVSEHGWNDYCGLLVNSTRGIIYAGSGEDFAEKAKLAAKELQEQMKTFMIAKGVL